MNDDTTQLQKNLHTTRGKIVTEQLEILREFKEALKKQETQKEPKEKNQQ